MFGGPVSNCESTTQITEAKLQLCSKQIEGWLCLYIVESSVAYIKRSDIVLRRLKKILHIKTVVELLLLHCKPFARSLINPNSDLKRGCLVGVLPTEHAVFKSIYLLIYAA